MGQKHGQENKLNLTTQTKITTYFIIIIYFIYMLWNILIFNQWKILIGHWQNICKIRQCREDMKTGKKGMKTCA